ncbi:hypothetical protein [Thalassotalea maritima]|uniref:hypothetical protein n=1 Tax=Thalassotalea maritima TaxID=3242416 RepID=UPI003529787D
MKCDYLQRAAWTLLLATGAISIEELESFGISKGRARSWLKSMPDDNQLLNAASKVSKQSVSADGPGENIISAHESEEGERVCLSESKDQVDAQPVADETKVDESSQSEEMITPPPLSAGKRVEDSDRELTSATCSVSVSVAVSIRATSGLHGEIKASLDLIQDNGTAHEV